MSFYKMLKNTFLIQLLLIVLLSNSCSWKSNKTQEPTWYLNPPKNDVRYLYGVGEGLNLETATQSALKNLSSKILVTISAETNLTREETNFYANEQIKQNIKEDIAKITFNNYEIERSDKKANKVYVVVKVNRNDFIKDKKGELNKINTQINNIDTLSQKQSILERRNSLETINNMVKDEAGLLIKVIGATDSNFNQSAYFQKYNEYKKEYRETNDKILFFISREALTSREITSVYNNALNKEGIKTVNIKNPNNPDQVILEIDSRSMSQKVYGNYMTKLFVTTTLKSNQGKSIAGKTIEITGTSVINEKQAFNTTIQMLEQKIAKEGIFTVLGLNK